MRFFTNSTSFNRQVSKPTLHKNFTLEKPYDLSHKISEYNPNLTLRVLDELVEFAKDRPCGNFANTAIIGVQHLLESTPPLFNSLIRLGLDPKNCYFRGKSYSTFPKVASQLQSLGINVLPDIAARRPGHYQQAKTNAMEDLWEKFLLSVRRKQHIEKLIILDEGGGCFETFPPEIWHSKYAIAAVEQTMQGLQNPAIDAFTRPIVEVASCAAKQKIESKLIASGIVKNIMKALNQVNLKNQFCCGVIGNGAIGLAVTKYLLGLGCSVTVYDEDENAFNEVLGDRCFRVSNVGAVITSSNVIFGCTGKDTLNTIDFVELINSDKLFISCSSGDIEFRSLLLQIEPQLPKKISPLCDITYETSKRKKIRIMRGGYPINFDNSHVSGTPSADIALTRGLLLSGLLQANLLAARPTPNGLFVNKTHRVALDHYLQRFVVSHFPHFATYPGISSQLLEKFNDVQWVAHNSGGSSPDNLGSNFGELACLELDTASPKLTR